MKFTTKVTICSITNISFKTVKLSVKKCTKKLNNAKMLLKTEDDCQPETHACSLCIYSVLDASHVIPNKYHSYRTTRPISTS